LVWLDTSLNMVDKPEKQSCQLAKVEVHAALETQAHFPNWLINLSQ